MRCPQSYQTPREQRRHEPADGPTPKAQSQETLPRQGHQSEDRRSQVRASFRTPILPLRFQTVHGQKEAVDFVFMDNMHTNLRLTSNVENGDVLIKSFKDRDTENLYRRQFVQKFSGFARQALKRLRILDSATSLQTVAALPSNRFEALNGNRKGQYSSRIHRQWRICFRWNDAPDDVEIVDYHEGNTP